MNEHNYCAVFSKQREDFLPGSATNYSKLLLIEYNRPWSNNAFTDSNISSVVKEYIAGFISAHSIKLFLIKNKDSNELGKRVFTFNFDPAKKYFNSFVVRSYGDLLNINLESFFESNIQPANELHYLVCTNGKKDKCCSKFGLPIYHELVKRNKNAWQCTHVGGDRFAANIILLPHSLCFGHMALNEIDGFINTSENNEIYHYKYRGRSIYRNYEQAAEYFLLKFLNNFLIDGCKLISSQKLSLQRSLVTFFNLHDGLTYQVNVEKELSDKTGFLTCTALKEANLPFFKLLSILRV